MSEKAKRFIRVFLMLHVVSFNAAAYEPDTLRICFIGDVMAHTRQMEVAEQVARKSGCSETYDFDAYFKHIESHIRECDINVANMEFSCGVRPYSGYPVFSAPASLPQAASDAGIDLFLAANNHVCDKSVAGLDSTYSIYSRLPVIFTGLYCSSEQEEIENPVILSCQGIKVAFVNFTYSLNGFTAGGGYVVPMMDSVHVKNVICRARERGAEYVIALPHWGEEYKLDCSAEQRAWAANLYRWGADMVVGGHPHVPQAVEYDGKHVTAYSLGNYISNMSVPYAQIGIMLTVSIVREPDGGITTAMPDVTYLWCGRGGFLEENYTTVPINEYLGHPEAFLEQSQYRKMVSEYNFIRNKFTEFEQDNNPSGD